MMKNCILISLFFICLNASSQKFEQIDTLLVVTDQSVKLKTSLPGDIVSDTIIYYKRITIDTIFFNARLNSPDTIFMDERYSKGRRYRNGNLIKTESRKSQSGLVYHGQKNGIWVETNMPYCFREGTFSPMKKQYFRDQELFTNFSEKYFFLSDTIAGKIFFYSRSPEYLHDNLYLRCVPNEISAYSCSVYLNEDKLLLQCRMDELEFHLNKILEGEYRREIQKIP